MENRSLVTIAEHSKEKILYLLEMAKSWTAKLLPPFSLSPPPVHDSVLKPQQTDWEPALSDLPIPK